jgi:hypothetical protein
MALLFVALMLLPLVAVFYDVAVSSPKKAFTNAASTDVAPTQGTLAR